MEACGIDQVLATEFKGCVVTFYLQQEIPWATVNPLHPVPITEQGMLALRFLSQY